MPSQKLFSLRRWCLLCVALLILFAPTRAQDQQSTSSPAERVKGDLAERRRQLLAPSVGLEIISSRKTETALLYNGSVNSFSISRDVISIVNQEATGDFSFIEVKAEITENNIQVRLSVIYNKMSELSQPEWWKNKKEKEVGKYTIAIGESIRPAELLQFGIEPFEIKAISKKPVALKREEYPRIFNPSNTLEVTEVEKSLAGYRFSFKNLSTKDIIALEIWSGNGGSGIGGGGLGYRGQQSVLPSGETYEEFNMIAASDVEKYGLTIKMILYSDGTYEGDVLSATRHLARAEGYKIQAAKLLPGLEQALNVADEELSDFLLKMEAGLWQMPEAMDKASSIEFLKIKYPAFDEPTISNLYEDFKSGFYNARNTLLSDLGQIKRHIEEARDAETTTDKVRVYRHILTRLKEVIVKATSSSF